LRRREVERAVELAGGGPDPISVAIERRGRSAALERGDARVDFALFPPDTHTDGFRPIEQYRIGTR
jgi:hypothetical protein